MSKSDLMNCISDRKNEIIDKLKNGDTEESFQIGGASYTQTEWDKLLSKVDANIDEIKEEQEEEKEEYIQECYEKETAKRNIFMEKLNGTYKETVPYGYLEKDGVITYNGVTFVCDEQSNSICLGDMSNSKNVITIPLADGGSLKVNRDNIGDLSKAISMFSPEDINRIMRAIADDNKAQEELHEIEDEEDSISKLTSDNEETSVIYTESDGSQKFDREMLASRPNAQNITYSFAGSAKEYTFDEYVSEVERLIQKNQNK
jgi:hypothetical protein